MTILWFLVFPVERKQRRPSYGRVVQLGLQLQKHHSSSPCQWPALPWCPSLSYPGQVSLQLEEKPYCCNGKDMWQVLAGVPEGSLSPVSSVKGWEVCHQHHIARHLYFYWMLSQTTKSNLAFFSFFFLSSFLLPFYKIAGELHRHSSLGNTLVTHCTGSKNYWSRIKSGQLPVFNSHFAGTQLPLLMDCWWLFSRPWKNWVATAEDAVTLPEAFAFGSFYRSSLATASG